MNCPFAGFSCLDRPFPADRRRSLPGLGLVLLLVLSAALPPAQAAEKPPAINLGDLSIEELMNESVTSVSKKETKLNQSPAAIAVVNPEDLRRLGITTIPEALRLVAGMDVARISANSWAVSGRGFNHEFAHYLLVLIDGRSIYTPASGGVFWNAQDVVFEDVERIEVIRGPGATLWGANAVNGVVNLTTKSAKDTQGGLVSVAQGTEDQPSVTVRYGGRLAPNLYYRVFAKYFNRDGLADAAGGAAGDAWHTLRGGFRADWAPSTSDEFMFEGDYYSGRAGKRVTQITLAPPSVQPVDHVEPNRGGHLLGRWTRTFSETSELSVQTYYDRVEQGDGLGVEYRDTGDFDLHHRLALGERHDVVWGTGYRHAAVDNTPSFNLTWTPQRQQLRLFNLFAQDEITLAPDRLHFTLGSKLEHNNLTGWSVLPSARLLWTPAANQTVWAAVSRATRTPALFERNSRLNVAAFQPAPAGPVVLLSQFGNQGLDEEKLVAYEVGWRVELAKQLTFDVTAFQNVYDDLISLEANPAGFEASPAPPHLLVSSTYQNGNTGRTYGVELSVQWHPMNHWHWVGSYSWLHMRLRPDASAESDSPQQQFQIRSYLDLPHHWELNGALYYVDRVNPPAGPGRAAIAAYVRLDLGVTWRPTEALELGVWGQNLVDHRHTEFPSFGSAVLTQVPRGVTSRVTWRF